LDDAFGAIDATTSPTISTDDVPRPDPCKLPPKWFGKRGGVTFGFGGKMVQWSSGEKNGEVEIKQIITEPKARV